MVVEARPRDTERWVVMDALYGQVFERADGKLASFADVEGDWAQYQGQIAESYPRKFDYDGVRYTNWDKVPVLMPSVRYLLEAVLGRDTVATMSLRTSLLNLYDVYSSVLLGLLVVSGSVLALVRVRRRRRSRQHSETAAARRKSA
jgi:hypothetical protein